MATAADKHHVSKKVPTSSKPVPSATRNVGRLAEWYEPGRDFSFYAASREACRAVRSRIDQFRLSNTEIKDLASCTTIDSLLDTVNNHCIQQQSNSAFSPKLREFATQFCEFASQLAELIQPLLPQSPEYTVTFGLVGLLFRSIVEAKRQQERLAAHIESLTSNMPLVGFYESVYPTNQMKMVVAELYVKVLSFLEEILLYSRSGRLGKIVEVFMAKEDRLELLIVDIGVQTAKLKALAEAGHAAQQADMQDLMHTMSSDLSRTHQEMQTFNTAMSLSLTVLDDKCEAMRNLTESMFAAQSYVFVQGLCESILPEGREPYEEAYAAVSHIDQQSPRDHWDANGVLDALHAWSVSPQEYPLWIGGKSSNRGTWVTQFAKDLVFALDSQQVNVYCAFCDQVEAPSAVTIARTLVYQIVARHSALVYKHAAIFAACRFRQASTFEDVWGILEDLVALISPELIVLVVDRVECCNNTQMVQDGLIPGLVRMSGEGSNMRVILTSFYEPPDGLLDVMQHVYIETGSIPGVRHLGAGQSRRQHDLIR